MMAKPIRALELQYPILIKEIIGSEINYDWINLFSLDQNSGHYPGAVNIPYPSLFNSETKALKTVDELKKGKLLYNFNLLYR